MAIQMREGTITFPPTTGRRQRRQTTVVFPSSILGNNAQAVLKGYNVNYNNGDHHILELEIDLDTRIVGNTVTVFADLAFRDSSGFFDDSYDGFVNFVVLADI